MLLKINGTEIAAYPATFQPTVMDLDDGDATVRTANGTLNRSRIRVLRQIDMTWGILTAAQISALLQSMSGVFFDFYYLDIMSGKYETRRMYVGNRTAPIALSKGNETLYNALKLTLTER
ncbi:MULTISPECIES: DUF6711 family protein [unclassified Paenibacillus]|uniref:DUF6711 family protein n=1 Tax=unclassified Paenibacillus TaxID=185978 RepID=UPI00240570A7|nr:MULTISPECIES: DUF6711 family protein [unclassified Paenibacillus]MDF9845170.1 hypothetical protein [Paenibacillus sp. PastF-2]MDF9850338.1 hypothetical protein [Paenibacillus sp. PastM-2]MDF9856959.1 hypothetical protein [Paenibacillus sp. PastF-1]MDH6482184.1 hypothetical protein [Paenibacillus sp. PastH-2]MDH6509652.1 hypothetical protein [Paenibacillus sp. PastM-3]